MLMKLEDSLLLIIDVQERLTPAMDNPRDVINNCAGLIGVAKRLGIPTFITEQYPQGLGPTMFDLREEAGENALYFPKMEFSCAKNEKIMEAIKKSGKKQIVIAGIECHICITQTALDLKALGYEVFVVANASSSRKALQAGMALQRLMHNGVEVVTLEMAYFEWLQKAGTPEFKEISKRYIV